MKRNKSKLIAIIAILVVLIIGVMIAILYLATDIFKGNQELFYKYFSQNMENMEEIFKTANKEDFETLKNNAHTTDTTINFDISSSNPEIANQMIPARNFSVQIKSQEDPLNSKKYSETTLKFLTRDLFTLKYIQDGDKYGIKSDEVVNKYLTFENNNLKEFLSKYGVDTTNVPDKIGKINFKDLFTLTDEEKNTILENYTSVIKSNVSSDKYIKQRQTAVEINGETTIANMYALEMTNQELNDVIIAVLQHLRQDNYTLNILLRKMQLIDENITMSNVTELIQNLVQSMTNQSATGTFRIALYEKNSEIVKIVISNSEVCEIAIDYRKSQDAINATITLDYYYTPDTPIVDDEPEIDDGYQIIEDVNPVTPTEPEEGGQLEIAGVNETISSIKKIEIAKQTKETGSKTIVIATIEGPDGNVNVSFQNEITMNNSQVANKNVIININDNETYFNINMMSTFTQAAGLTIEDLTGDNSAIINNFTTTYMQKIITDLINRLQTLFGQKLEIIATVQEEEGSNATNQNADGNTLIEGNNNQNPTTNEQTNTVTTDNTITNNVTSDNSIQNTTNPTL